MIRVIVTPKDIAAGVGGDCYRCPIALALARATRDTEANVYERDWELRIEVWGRHILAPREVLEFVWSFDGQPRTDDGRIDPGHEDYEPPDPFEFELPDLTDPEWEERCYHCEELFDASELDDEGLCKECAKRVDRTEGRDDRDRD